MIENRNIYGTFIKSCNNFFFGEKGIEWVFYSVCLARRNRCGKSKP